MSTLKIGCGRADITPTQPSALSGFIARLNKPFTRVEDPLSMRALVLEADGQTYFLLNYELLGFDASVHQMLLAALEAHIGAVFTRENCVVTTTHTHSGPSVSPIEGETFAGDEYLDLLCLQTVEAVRQGLRQLRPASMAAASQEIEGLTYNRRAVLADGRVSIAYDPDMAVVERGLLDKTLTLLVWRDASDPHKNLAALVHFPCHGVALLTPAVSGDIPGQIARHMEEKLGAPCLFLQGTSGDVNPIMVAGERPAMLEWCQQFFAQVDGIEDRLEAEACLPVRGESAVVPIDFQALPAREQVECNIALLDQIAAGDFSDWQAAGTVSAVANMLNIRPGEEPDAGQAAFTALALANAERRVLAEVEKGQQPAACPLNMAGWRIGGVFLIFMGGEIFSVTGERLRALDKDQRILPVTYAAPVIGYIPDADSMQQGGYEASEAWRFYRQPAPFAFDSEQRIVETAEKLISRLKA
jgi:hypothetical protein